MKAKQALVVVDLQNDFCPGGALGVREGDLIIPAVNKYVKLFLNKNLPVFVSRDWHPKTTKHFQESGGPWPPHCIQNTRGAEFHPDFQVPGQAIILSKGINPDMDGYSVFDAQNAQGKFLEDMLDEMGVQELYIGGIATDYCVRMTSLDAIKKKFKVNVLVDAIKGVDEEDSRRTIDEIVAKKGNLKTYSDVSSELSDGF